MAGDVREPPGGPSGDNGGGGRLPGQYPGQGCSFCGPARRSLDLPLHGAADPSAALVLPVRIPGVGLRYLSAPETHGRGLHDRTILTFLAAEVRLPASLDPARPQVLSVQRGLRGGRVRDRADRLVLRLRRIFRSRVPDTLAGFRPATEREPHRRVPLHDRDYPGRRSRFLHRPLSGAQGAAAVGVPQDPPLGPGAEPTHQLPLPPHRPHPDRPIRGTADGGGQRRFRLRLPGSPSPTRVGSPR